MDIDLAARRIVMASYLYYRRDKSIITDADFDAYCKLVADNWDKLKPLRQWQLGSAEDIRASGYMVRVTVAAEDGAYAWYRQVYGHEIPVDTVGPISKWTMDETQQCRWAYCI